MPERRQLPLEKTVAPSAARRGAGAREEAQIRWPSCGRVQSAETDEVCLYCGRSRHDGDASLPKLGVRALPGTHPDEAREAWATLVMDTVQESSGYHRRKRITSRVFCLLGFIALLPLAVFLYWCLSPIWFWLSWGK